MSKHQIGRILNIIGSFKIANNRPQRLLQILKCSYFHHQLNQNLHGFKMRATPEFFYQNILHMFLVGNVLKALNLLGNILLGGFDHTRQMPNHRQHLAADHQLVVGLGGLTIPAQQGPPTKIPVLPAP